MHLNWLSLDNRSQVYPFYKQFMPYARLTKKERIAVFIAEQNTAEVTVKSEVIAAVRLRPTGLYTLVTGMLIHPAHRGKGLGHALMREISHEMIDKRTFIFSLPHLVNFYRQHGFERCQTPPNDIGQLFNRYHSEEKPLSLLIFKRNMAE
ncbi:GNAT family N-acetyltransferase [Shewanella nanhaiensis]|uniref:GNAT family N-acetyltransferase n=1 Tax=Shewanella nanhaiensis TaxID=2864872 RepID=A0ABS7E3W0_9GAMM|nr:GNAT family N-acetyltransferase [Shewanella nanhaiensis]MBW8184376.1 GNAT family N-acetyltransferase [Shewanella nanhaiensis]